MKIIEKWLNENKISYEKDKYGNLSIILERDCIWVNGFGEPMSYNKEIYISKNTYGMYHAYEVTGYSLKHKLGFSTKQASIVDILEERLKDEINKIEEYEK